MPGGLGGIANAIAPAVPLVNVGLAGAGEVGNLIEGHKQNDYQNYVLNLAKNPAFLSQMIVKATQPLSASLIQGLNNSVQGDLASRGLAQAPGIFAQAEGQAIAPYLLAQQDQARQQVLAALGIGQNSLPPPQGQQNMTFALMQALQALGKGQPQTAQINQLNQQPTASPGGIVPPGFIPGVAPGQTPPTFPTDIFAPTYNPSPPSYTGDQSYGGGGIGS